MNRKEIEKRMVKMRAEMEKNFKEHLAPVVEKYIWEANDVDVEEMLMRSTCLANIMTDATMAMLDANLRLIEEDKKRNAATLQMMHLIARFNDKVYQLTPDDMEEGYKEAEEDLKKFY